VGTVLLSRVIGLIFFRTALVGVGLRVLNEKNVIIRNVKVSKVLAGAGDAIGIQASSQVWLDHLDLSSDRDHDKVCISVSTCRNPLLICFFTRTSSSWLFR
jgi:pectate lyase